MKSFSQLRALLLAVFLFSLCYGQGVYIQPFGSSYEDVKRFLDDQNTAQSSLTEDQITVWTNNYQIQYFFRDQRLYKLELIRDYSDRKEFREGMLSLRTKYEYQGLGIIDLNSERDEQAFVVRQGNELHEIYQVPLGRNSFQLRQMLLDIDGCTSEERVALRKDQHFASLLVDY